MIIEFVGIPGSGKTTVAPLVAAGLTEQGTPTTVLRAGHHHYRSGWSKRVRVLIVNPRLTLALAGTLARDRRKQALSWLINVARRSAVPVPRDTVVDEGVLHGVCAASLRIRADMAPVVRRVSLPDIVVRLRVPAAVAHDRVQGSSRTVAPMGEREAAGWLARFEGSIDGVCNLLAIPVVDVDAARPPAVIAGDVVASLAELLASNGFSSQPEESEPRPDGGRRGGPSRAERLR